MLRRENILITEDYMSKTTSATHFTAPGEIECFDSSIHFGKESDRVEIQNCNIKNNVLVRCSKDDTYDFEIGALIALMKMCGAKKSAEACCEAFPHETSGSIYRENKRYIKRIKELEEENENLKSDCDKYFKEVENLVVKKNELIEENEKLKLDCEKLQHGYIDTDMIFCGGRQNGKQHTALVNMFKKIDQKKVDEAHKEAYNTKLPLWQKEVLKQMCDIYKESEEKTVQIKGFNINIKPPAKREEMWNDILSCGDCEHSEYVKVKKEDLQAFVKECNEKKIFNVIGDEFRSGECWFDDDSCIFQIFRKSAGFVCANRVYLVLKDVIVDYLPPMRWDLFKKGRLAVRLTKDNYKDFYDICEKELGRSPSYKPEDFPYTPMEKFVLKYNKKSKGYTFLSTTESEKIVNWEDVR